MSSAKQNLNVDFCIIGGGSGGLYFAAGAAQMGASVVLLEKNKMGGDCLNYGCVPSKSLISAAKYGHQFDKSLDFGWGATKPKLDFSKVYDHIHNVIKNIEPNDSVERFEGLGVKVIAEEGAFESEDILSSKDYQIKAKRFIIATGSKPFIPPIEGLQDVPFLTNETIFDLQTLPKHLVVIGGGPIGIEMAQAFKRLGSKVTVLETFGVLPKDDPEITAILKNILVEEGVELMEGVAINNISKDKTSIQVTYKNTDNKEEKLLASHILVATGRRSNVENLRLDNALVKFSPRGIEVDQYLRTSNKKIYAIGDVTGGYQFTHVASYHAGIALRNSIFGAWSKASTKAIPWVTYTDPELAHVGMLESQLKEQKTSFKTFKMDFTDNDRAQAQKETTGKIKLLASNRGDILGVTILGRNAGELIYPWVIAMQNNLKLSSIASSIAPYPTMSEISKRIAGQFYGEKIFSSKMKKLVQFIMKWFH